MTRGDRISVRGSWPGAVVLRQGWARAQARPWNDHSGDASIRFDRGTAGFLAGCVDVLCRLGADSVLSVPLYRSSVGVWERAGFRLHRELLLLERVLDGSTARDRKPRNRGPSSVQVWPDETWLEVVAQIDELSFDQEWQLGRLGLREASEATPTGAVLTDGVPGGRVPRGFAIVGSSGSIGYLQRLGVAPEAQGSGLGRDLLQSSLQWARSRGARTVLVNTQPDNGRSLALYTSEGFHVIPDRLKVMRSVPKPT